MECTVKLKEQRQDGVAGGKMRIVVDGFNAPLTAGNYIDLVQRGFYNGMEIQRADGFVVQTGDPGPPVRACGLICRVFLGFRASGLEGHAPAQACAGVCQKMYVLHAVKQYPLGLSRCMPKVAPFQANR